MATLYKQAKSVAPTHTFLSSYNYEKLVRELKQDHDARWVRDHTQAQEVVSVDTFVGRVTISIVAEDSKDFILIGSEDDYLNYVMERTVL